MTIVMTTDWGILTVKRQLDGMIDINIRKEERKQLLFADVMIFIFRKPKTLGSKNT